MKEIDLDKISVPEKKGIYALASQKYVALIFDLGWLMLGIHFQISQS